MKSRRSPRAIGACRIAYDRATGAANDQDFDKFAARAAPAIFVLLWSTGFIGTKYVVNNADPLDLSGDPHGDRGWVDGRHLRHRPAGMAEPRRDRAQRRRRHSGARDLSRRHGDRDLAVYSRGPFGADPGPAADPDVDHREPLARRARDRDAMGRAVARARRRCADPARPADERAGRLGLDRLGGIAGQHHARHALPAALLQPHRLAQRQSRAICRGDRVLHDRRFPVRSARGALDHRIHSRAWPGSRWCCRSDRSACCTG